MTKCTGGFLRPDSFKKLVSKCVVFGIGKVCGNRRRLYERSRRLEGKPLPRELMRIHTLHLVVGLASLAFFAATGVYLRLHAPPLAALELGPHMLLTSCHVYLLFGGLLNVVAGFRGSTENKDYGLPGQNRQVFRVKQYDPGARGRVYDNAWVYTNWQIRVWALNGNGLSSGWSGWTTIQGGLFGEP